MRVVDDKQSARRMIAACLGLLLGGAVSAAPVTVNFSGVSNFSSFNLFPSGQTLTGSFSYELSTTPTTSGGGSSRYSALTRLDLSIGGYSASTVSPSPLDNVQIANNQSGTGDQFILHTFRSSPPGASGLVGPPITDSFSIQRSPSLFQLVLRDSSGAAFATDQQLPATLSFGSFNSTSFILQFNSSTLGNPVSVEGILTSLSTVAAPPVTPPPGPGVGVVPEPSTYALMLAGLGLLGFMARRRAPR